MYFTIIRDIAEFFFFIAGIILAGTAIYGLKQIRLMKQDIETRNDRAAKEKAIEYASRYLYKFIELNSINYK